jgi:hypothetical protein
VEGELNWLGTLITRMFRNVDLQGLKSVSSAFGNPFYPRAIFQTIFRKIALER